MSGPDIRSDDSRCKGFMCTTMERIIKEIIIREARTRRSRAVACMRDAIPIVGTPFLCASAAQIGPLGAMRL
jgi:hypothetical protein